MYFLNHKRDRAPGRDVGRRGGPSAETGVGFWELPEWLARGRSLVTGAAQAGATAIRAAAECARRADAVDVAHAVSRNTVHANRIGWGSQRPAVARVVGSQPNASPADFARAVARWQCLRRLEADGIVGPNTWRAMASSVATETPRPDTAPQATDSTALPAGPFGVLTVNAPEMYRFQYRLTPEDGLWLARLIVGEAGGQDDPDNRAVVWAVLNRFALFTHAGSYWMRRAKLRGYPTLASFVRAYSTTLQPVLNSPKAALRAIRNSRRNPKRFHYERTGGVYPGTSIPKGQYKHHRDRIQRMTWQSFKPATRSLIVRALRGQLPNPVGLASEFGNTWTYFKDNHGGKAPSGYDQWRDYTVRHARKKRWTWVGPRPGLNQIRSNAFFIDNRVKNLPPDTVKVVFNG